MYELPGTPRFGLTGRDTALASAIGDVRARHWRGMADLIRATADRHVRTARSQVLAAVANVELITAWRREQPGPDADMMWCRFLTNEALRAHGAGDAETAARRRQAAWDVARPLISRAPFDPVPWVCFIALAETDPQRRIREHWHPPPAPLLPAAPWAWLREATRPDRAPHNREAHHRMLRVLTRCHSPAAATEFAVDSARTCPDGSPLLALPLYTHVAAMAASRDRLGHAAGLAERQWRSEHVQQHTRAAYERGFLRAPQLWDGPDLGHLAYALWAGGDLAAAWEVFAAMGDQPSPLPWKGTAPASSDGARHFAQVRDECWSAARQIRPT